MKELENKINIIRNYFKKTNLFLEICLLNYETYNIYIRIDYYKKLNIYKLSWFDLDIIKYDNIQKYMGSEYISGKVINEIIDILMDKDNYFCEECEENVVILNYYVDEGISYRFKRFIPKELFFLSEVFILIFDHLPRKLDNFLYELHAEMMGTRSKYEYHDSFIFDLFKDSLEDIFDKRIIDRGKKYYEEERVEFLEKIDDKYYAIVKGVEKYLIVIKYDENTKEIRLYCTCPCEFFCKHIYAVIKCIREGKFRNFYKVLYVNKRDNLLENVINSKHLLCSGVNGDCLEIINKYGEIELVFLFDENGDINFKILEDDGSLLSKIEKMM